MAEERGGPLRPMGAPRLLAAAALLLAAAVSADDRVAGHWEGKIQVPGQPLVVKVDLESSGGLWSGSIDIPAQGAAGLPLEGIEVSEDASEVSFSIRGVPGHPTFRGTLDGDVISGRFTQGPRRPRLPPLAGGGPRAGPAAGAPSPVSVRVGRGQLPERSPSPSPAP